MNKRYIKTVFIILSLVAYASNKAHASEADSETENLNSVSTENLATNENQENGELVESHDPEAPQDEEGEENYASEETQGEQGEENYGSSETQGDEEEENYGSSETLNYQGEENYAPEETQGEQGEENYAYEETQGEQGEENYAYEETQVEQGEENYAYEETQVEQGEENYAYEETQVGQGEENYAYEETQVGQGEENYGSSETLNYQGEENYAPEETQAEVIVENYGSSETLNEQIEESDAPKETQGEVIVENNAPEEAQAEEIVENNAPEETQAEEIVENNAPEETHAEVIVENNAPEETQAEEIVENNPPKETKKEELVEYSEADVNERAHEIMSKVLDRVRRYSDIYNTQNCFYFPNPTRYVCFTVDENVEIARFHLVIQDLNKYDAIVNFLRGIDDIYHFGRKDDKAIIIGKYGPNLQMLQRYKKTAENRPNIYSFGLFTTVDDSEDMSIIAKTWADIYDVKHVYKKNGEKSGKTTKRFHTAHDLAKASEDVVMHNMFTDLSAFVVKRHEDNIGVTYVEYNPRFKYDPDNYKSTDDRANSMMALMDRMYAILNQ
ncbi:fam-a protein [Plasmodium chabaudi chabaudi]|uniref:Fam-a protein n=1 Tax=Plasmodium chabaudi chabaudi TaxID=31271 RepID=A0A4V0K7J0_PLACU|nr:fam-a protein [Plasmodium chabaudi chabaudi]VTZ68985.1 fam-a protein [Plasmodium chabaudi chabaudi]|eukprot:XP_016655457.1 fam-a protein [Plasmodium chabaudi chabaudi]